MKLQKEDIIYRWALLTLKVDTFFEMATGDSSDTDFANTLQKSVENHLELGCGDFKIVHQYFLNTRKAKELVFSNKMQNVPGYYNWISPESRKILTEKGCYRN